jgi:hypothetical protein
MIPFRTKGWLYFDKSLDIIPNASARGGHAFSAMHAAPPIPVDHTFDLDGLDKGTSGADAPGETSSNQNKITDAMDVDKEGDAETQGIAPFISPSSFAKRKLATVISDDDSAIAPSETSFASSSKLSASSIAPEPMKKKSATSLSSIKSAPKSKASSPSARPSRSAQGSSRTSSKLSPALLVHEMQGSINTLAAAVRESGATDPVAKLRQEAVHAVSQRDDGLSLADKIKVLELFRKDYASVQTYLALLEFDDVRKGWLQTQLK